jgi:hypothetical protein
MYIYIYIYKQNLFSIRASQEDVGKGYLYNNLCLLPPSDPNDPFITLKIKNHIYMHINK